ncbi:hypothetical protein GF389_00285 [Candidatus Dojkabacteria bacterium]|nr:hypothetical protein [Candidatus Dojkabacteria bacterium]
MVKERNNNQNNVFLFLIGLMGIALAFTILDQLKVLDQLKQASEGLQGGYRHQIREQVDGIEEIFYVVGDLGNLKNERDEYKEEVEDLSSQLAEMEAEIRELEAYKLQSEYSFSGNYKLIPARVIRISNEESGVFYINKGTKNDLENGDIVVYKSYALGEIIEISSRSAKVRDIFSKDVKISAISRDGVKGVFVSEQGVRLKVEKILSDEEVEIGDRFVTLGVNSNYPPDLYLGRVKEIEESPSQTTKSVVLETEINPFNLHEVFVLDYEN